MTDPPEFEAAPGVTDKVLQELLNAFADDPDNAETARAAKDAAASARRTIVIADDGLDEAPVRDPAGDGPRGGVIVIDGEDDPSLPVVASPTAPDDRIRARRIAVRRAAGRKRLKWVGVIAAVVLVIVGTLVVLASSLFAIRTVNVEGAVYTDQAALQSVVDDLQGSPILTADLDGAERRLEQIPWVSDARVTMKFPHEVTIQLAERTPLAFYRGVDGLNRVIDIDGRVLGVMEGTPVDFMPINGDGPAIAAGAFTSSSFAAAAKLVNAIPVRVRPSILSISVSDVGELSMDVEGGILVLFGVPDNYQVKLVSAVNELERHEPGTISVIDVSSGEPSVR